MTRMDPGESGAAQERSGLMKRSEINKGIKDMEQLIMEHKFEIPPFTKWTAGEWSDKGHEYDEIRDNKLGWDITDFGLGKFSQTGFSLLTIRNGNLNMDQYKKTYITVYNGSEDGRILDTDVTVRMDGKLSIVSAGTKVKLSPGESITITPYMYHDFAVPDTGGSVLLGEVSMCNDDDNDNRFYDAAVGRFPEIEEDEPPYRLLCNEYPEAGQTY